MPKKFNTPAKKSLAIAVEPGDEELADKAGKKRTGGLVDDKLLAQSGKKGGLVDDELLAKSGKTGGLVGDDTELA